MNFWVHFRHNEWQHNLYKDHVDKITLAFVHDFDHKQHKGGFIIRQTLLFLQINFCFKILK